VATHRIRQTPIVRGTELVGIITATDLILVDYDERITNVAEILALIKKVGYEAITLAAPHF
jgi:CBS domain-containing protein